MTPIGKLWCGLGLVVALVAYVCGTAVLHVLGAEEEDTNV